MLMKRVSLLIILSYLKFTRGQEADQCSPDKCEVREDCRCSLAACPIDKSSAPQLIALTFDEAVTQLLYETYWDPLLMNRVNPDGIPIGATFFVPHEFTDYIRVNDLYNFGFEIGVHSITSNNDQEYWRNASVETIEKEFGGQRTIISKFANIPIADIKGVRTPQLQLSGNNSIKGFVNQKFLYDSSWPTNSGSPLFPYTLDYLSTQECVLGARCPNEAFKGFWESPIINLKGQNGEQCSTLAGCFLTSSSANDIANWLFNEVTRVRNDSRAPLTLIVESQFFEKLPNNVIFEAFNLAMDKLLALGDTYFVSQGQLIDWIKNPVPKEQFKTEFDESRAASCNQARICTWIKTGTKESITIRTCVACPTNYPWLDNPLGN